MPKIQYLHKTRQRIPGIYAQKFGDILQNMNFSRYYRNRGKFIYGFDPNIIKIIASKQECEAYGFDEFSYDGALLFAEKLTATMKGTSTEAYHLLKEPVFYTYANKKNQIERLNIKLLDSPVNKNEETIVLQGYLYRRILAMKSSKKMKPIIVYDTVYKYLDIQATSDGALRKKKLKIRNTIKKILDYWKKQKFIISYAENSYKNEIVSITIRY